MGCPAQAEKILAYLLPLSNKKTRGEVGVTTGTKGVRQGGKVWRIVSLASTGMTRAVLSRNPRDKGQHGSEACLLQFQTVRQHRVESPYY